MGTARFRLIRRLRIFLGRSVIQRFRPFNPIDTVTRYLREARSTPLIEEILAAAPRRIIMNLGAENAALAVRAGKVGIEVVEDCTLVMLRAGQF